MEDMEEDTEETMETEAGEVEAQVELEDGESDEDEDEESGTEISLGDESEEPTPEEERAPAPKWVKDLRRERRDLVRENRELKAKIQAQTPQPEPRLGPKPKISDEGIDYDPEVFEAKILEWNDQRQHLVSIEAQKRKEEAQQEQAWEKTVNDYRKAKDALRISDFDDAEMVVQDALSQVQQGIILSGAALPAELVYALGKNPKELKALAGIADPVKFAVAIAKLEATKLRVNRKGVPAPEKRIVSAPAASLGGDSRLARLREEAAKTGDYTKVLEFKRRQKRA
jgi:hypothetical protein